MTGLTVLDHPLAGDLLTRLRDRETGPAEYRALTRRLGTLLVAAALVVPATYALYRTRWGLRLRACGEHPEAARSLGVPVARLRYQGVLLSGALAGLSGAFLSVEVAYSWSEGQTLGLGFIALAALILSNWNPVRLMLAAFIFGFAQAVPLRLADAPVIERIPPEFVRMTPYVVTIFVLAGYVGKVRPPEAAGRAYEGGST